MVEAQSLLFRNELMGHGLYRCLDFAARSMSNGR